MIPLPERPEGERPEGDAGFTPGFAVLISVGASFLSAFLAGLLISSEGTISASRLGFALLAAFATAFAIAAPRLEGPPARALGFLPPLPGAWRAALWLLPAVLLISEVDNVVRAFYPLPFDPDELPERGGFELVELALVAIVVSPVIGEVFFRGMIQPRLVDAWGEPYGVAAAAGLSSLPSLMLFGAWGMAPAVVQAAMLGFLRQRARSILPGLAIGMSYGVISLLATLRVFGIPGFDDLEAAHTPWPWLLFATLTTLLGLRAINALPDASKSSGAADD